MRRRIPMFCLAFALVGALAVGRPHAQTPLNQQTPPKPDQVAFTAANGLRDPDAKITALEKFKADFPASTLANAADIQILTALTTLPARAGEMGRVLDRLIARIPADAAPETRLTSTIAAVGPLVTKKLLLDRAEKLVGDALTACPEETPAASRGRGLEAMARIKTAGGNAAGAEQFYKDAVKATPTSMTAVTPLVEMYKTRGDSGAAETVLKAAIKASVTPTTGLPFAMMLADVYTKNNNLAGAEALLKSTIADLKNPPAPAKAVAAGTVTPGPAPAARTAANLNAPMAALADVYIKANNLDAADAILKELLSSNATLPAALIGQARLEEKRGNAAAALDRYMSVAITGALRGADYDGMVALYTKTHGSTAGLDDRLDAMYREKFPNPVKPERYTATTARSNRLVVLELFTGSGCPPCVAADLAFDGLLDRYPGADIAPLVYHVHIPQPDPMTTSNSETRRLFYGVTGVPTFEIDGAMVTNEKGTNRGGGARAGAPDLFGLYVTRIDKQLEAAPMGAVAVQAAGEGDLVTVTAKVSGLPAGAKDLRLHLVLAERELRFGGENGIRFHPMVVRGVAGDNAAGFALTGNATFTHTFNMAAVREDLVKSLAAEIAKRREGSATASYAAEGRAMTTIDPAELVVVAYVQAADKTVLQGAKADVVFAGAKKGER